MFKNESEVLLSQTGRHRSLKLKSHRIDEKDEVETTGFGPFFGEVDGIIESILI